VLKGEVRVSRALGLSLRYMTPEERIVIVDAQGLTMRPRPSDAVMPPQAAAGVAALLHILRLDFGALEKDFEAYGRREGNAWSIALVPRDPGTRKSMGNIHVAGEGVVVRTIELRRSARQHIDIAMTPPRSPVTFTPDEVKQYFR
jgi:hypothetical protein